jgi:hypothetical protein
MRNKFGFQWGLAVVLLIVYAAFWTWQTPGWLRGPLSSEEVEGYISVLEQNLPMPATEKALVLASMRTWGLADDGKPVYMLNLMRYYEQLKQLGGVPPFQGTAKEANELYEEGVQPLLLGRGIYPLIGGMTQGSNLLEHAAELDNWSRVLIVRYPSRRTVFELFTDPDYLPLVPYKLMSLQVVLTPVYGDLLIPELRWLVGGALLLIFVAVGWMRAARRR